MSMFKHYFNFAVRLRRGGVSVPGGEHAGLADICCSKKMDEKELADIVGPDIADRYAARIGLPERTPYHFSIQITDIEELPGEVSDLWNTNSGKQS